MQPVQKWFIRCIRDAESKKRLSSGSWTGYDEAGFQLGCKWQDAVDETIDVDALQDRIRTLCAGRGDQSAPAQTVLTAEFADYWAMVPTQRRSTFVWGFLRGIADAEGFDAPDRPS